MADAIELMEEKRESQDFEGSQMAVVIEEVSPIQRVSEEQYLMIQHVYDSAKRMSESLFSDSTLDSSLKITQLIAQLMALMEHVQGKKISGADKKAIVLELGRLLIKDHVNDDIRRVKMLLMYDVLAEKTLEVMIDVSHVVNKQLAKGVSSCWEGLASLCAKQSQ